MIRKIGLIICLGAVILFASASSDVERSKAAENTPTAEPTAEPSFETVTIDISDLEPVTEEMLIGYKDEDYYKRYSEYSHNTVLLSVDESILDNAGVLDLCDKYGLSIMYDYQNFSMYALTSEEAFSDEELATLIKNLSQENGVLSVEKDYICHITDGANLGLSLGID